jgi:FemAB-related protein (PEP-CTERM system-associated)
MTLEIRPALAADGAAWDAYVDRHVDGTPYHRFAWTGIVRGLGHAPVYLAAWDGGAVRGVLPLVVVAHPLFGRRAVSMPFVSYGGVLADDDDAAWALYEAAAVAVGEHRAKSLELRNRRALPREVPTDDFKVLGLLPLEADPEAVFSRVRKQTRTSVRKAEKSGVVVESGPDFLDDFHDVYARNLRDLGTPVMGKPFFRAVKDAFGEGALFYRALHEGKVIGAKLMFVHGDRRYFAWAATLREYNAVQPAALLQWRAIADACLAGATLCDMGRSNKDSGHADFKRHFGAELVPLYWQYHLRDDGGRPGLHTKNERMAPLIRLWRTLPLWLTNRVGPWLAKGLP